MSGRRTTWRHYAFWQGAIKGQIDCSRSLQLSPFESRLLAVVPGSSDFTATKRRPASPNDHRR